MTTFQAVLIAQIILSSVMTVWSRHTALKARQYALTVGIILYACVASMGILISLVINQALPSLPSGIVWAFLLLQGLMIPLSWIMQFKIITHVGASNSVIVGTFNILGAATLGLLFLGESISLSMVLGSIILLAAIYIVIGINPDRSHHKHVSRLRVFTYILVSFTAFSIGIFFEKKAINAIGVSDYIVYGWSLQLLGALFWFKLFSKQRLAGTPKIVIKNSIILGILTSLAGLLFIIALSLGSLSQTILATSGKITITTFLAAIFLNERNDIWLRLLAFIMAIVGIGLILF